MNADATPIAADKSKAMRIVREAAGNTRTYFTLLSAAICVASAGIGVPRIVNAQQMYKCVQDGKTVYQQEQCPTTAKETTLRGSDPPAATKSQVIDGEAKAEKTNAQGFELVADVTTGFNLCTDYDPEFRAKYTNTYNEWAGRNSAAVKAFTADPNSTKTVQERMAISRARTAGDDLEAKAKRAAVCAKVLAVIQ